MAAIFCASLFRVKTHTLPHAATSILPPAPASPIRRLLTAKQAAERLGVVPDTIWGWCQSKHLRHRKIGRMIRIDPADLDEFEYPRTVEPRL